MLDYKVSQNFLVNKKLVESLIAKCKFESTDTILDIGAGDGVITSILLDYSDNILAYEPDDKYYRALQERFANKPVKLAKDFLKLPLPLSPFKVFSNIPFSRTAEITKKLLDTDNMCKSYLVMQKEAALKLAGEQMYSKNTMMSVIYGVIYKFNNAYNFSRNDFRPVPSVDIILLEVYKREKALISAEKFSQFCNFTAYLFNKSRPYISDCRDIFTHTQLSRFEKDLKILPKSRVSDVSLNSFVALFNLVLPSGKLDKIRGLYSKILEQQANLSKIHRTRSAVFIRRD